MAKRLSTLTKFRLEKVVRELKEIQTDQTFNKIDLWNLQQATGMLEYVLDRSRRSATRNGDPDAK